jgi:hypothetical protein
MSRLMRFLMSSKYIGDDTGGGTTGGTADGTGTIGTIIITGGVAGNGRWMLQPACLRRGVVIFHPISVFGGISSNTPDLYSRARSR